MYIVLSTVLPIPGSSMLTSIRKTDSRIIFAKKALAKKLFMFKNLLAFLSFEVNDILFVFWYPVCYEPWMGYIDV